nr:zinc-binding dehydrogenase [Myxococcota bacterium]
EGGFPAALERIGEWVASGAVRPPIGARYAFEDLPAALSALAGREATGKLVLQRP